jgi:hypothetical protein
VGYYLTKTVETPFDKILEKVTSTLKEQGFGVLTDIEVQETLRKRLDVAFRKYRILEPATRPSLIKPFKWRTRSGYFYLQSDSTEDCPRQCGGFRHGSGRSDGHDRQYLPKRYVRGGTFLPASGG